MPIKVSDFLSTSFVGFTGSQGLPGQISWSKKTANYTAVHRDGLIADTTAGGFTITLPATPSLGDYVTIADGGDWGTNNLIIARNGSTIEGAAEDLTLDVGNTRVDFVYDGNTWEVFANVGQRGYTGSGGSVIVSDDTTTNATRYITFVSSTSGTSPTSNVASSKLTFNPSSGTLSATEINSLSDEVFKTDINVLENALDVINNLEGVEFIWKETGKKSFGVTAQQVEQFIPEIVTTEDFKRVNYNSIIAFLIQAIKELNKKIEDNNGNTK